MTRVIVLSVVLAASIYFAAWSVAKGHRIAEPTSEMQPREARLIWSEMRLRAERVAHAETSATIREVIDSSNWIRRNGAISDAALGQIDAETFERIERHFETRGTR